MRSFSRSFRSVLVAAACAVIAAASYAADRVDHYASAVYGSVRNFLFGAVHAVAGPVERMQAPSVRLVQAKAFVLRIAKRERPVVTSAWRMCPSI